MNCFMDMKLSDFRQNQNYQVAYLQYNLTLLAYLQMMQAVLKVELVVFINFL